MWFAIGLHALFLGLAFVARTIVQVRRTGNTGFRAFGGPRSAVERAGVLLLTGGGVISVIGSIVGGALWPVSVIEGSVAEVGGVVVAIGALILIVWAQLVMGSSWRIGVDPTEFTELVMAGPFSVIRNPIFSGMLLFWVGVALIVPNVLTMLAPVVAVAGVELQVRLAEEPYLLRTHGAAYLRYAARTGRVMPFIGRLPLGTASSPTSDDTSGARRTT